jgi:hypothetical protein
MEGGVNMRIQANVNLAAMCITGLDCFGMDHWVEVAQDEFIDGVDDDALNGFFDQIGGSHLGVIDHLQSMDGVVSVTSNFGIITALIDQNNAEEVADWVIEHGSPRGINPNSLTVTVVENYWDKDFCAVTVYRPDHGPRQLLGCN